MKEDTRPELRTPSAIFHLGSHNDIAARSKNVLGAGVTSSLEGYKEVCNPITIEVVFVRYTRDQEHPWDIKEFPSILAKFFSSMQFPSTDTSNRKYVFTSYVRRTHADHFNINCFRESARELLLEQTSKRCSDKSVSDF